MTLLLASTLTFVSLYIRELNKQSEKVGARPSLTDQLPSARNVKIDADSPFTWKNKKDVPDIYKEIFSPSSDFYKSERARNELPYKKIVLERFADDGRYPAYSVTLFNSGHAELHSGKRAKKPGDFTGRVDPNTFARLSYALDRLAFAKFDRNYLADWNHDSTCVVRVETTLGQISVADYGSVGPIELWIIQQLLDGQREQIDWIESNEK